MRLEYMYPAIVKRPLGNGRTRHQVMAMHGSADVPEYSANEIPVALTLHGAVPGHEDHYLYHENRFYLPARDYPVSSVGARVGLDMVMLREIDDLCNRRDGRPISVQPPSVKLAVDSVAFRRDRYLANPENFTAIESYCWADIQAADRGTTQAMEDIEHWTHVAEAHMASLLAVNGHIWVPVPEPLIRVQTNLEVLKARVENVSVYSDRFRHRREMPKPFGWQELYKTSDYWSSHVVFESFADVQRLEELRIQNMPYRDVHIRSAFDASHPEKEIIRLSGALVVDLYNYAKCRPQDEKIPNEVQSLYGDLHSALSGENANVDFDTLEMSLEGLLMILKPTAFERPRFGPREWRGEEGRIPGMITAIERTLNRWRERTVELELGPQLRGPTSASTIKR